MEFELFKTKVEFKTDDSGTTNSGVVVQIIDEGQTLRVRDADNAVWEVSKCHVDII
ncbi:hypothetical protein [Bacillus sp. NEAU-Y102]